VRNGRIEPATAETFSLGFGFNDFGNVRKAIDTIREQVILEWAEALREVIMLLRRQMLIAKKDHLVIKEGLIYLLD